MGNQENLSKVITFVSSRMAERTGQDIVEINTILDARVRMLKRKGLSINDDLRKLSADGEEAVAFWEGIRRAAVVALGEQGANELRFQKNYIEPRQKSKQLQEMKRALEVPTPEVLDAAQKEFEQALDIRSMLAPFPVLVTPGVAYLARLVPGELQLWGAETKHGKTTNCAATHEPLIMSGQHTAHITIEEPEGTFRLRVACLTEGIDPTTVGAGKLPPAVIALLKARVKEQRPLLRVISGANFGRPEAFEAALVSLKDQGYSIVTFDYISKAVTNNAEGVNRAEQERIMLACEQFVKTGPPMIVLGQLRKFDHKNKADGVGERFRGHRALHLYADNTIEMRAFKSVFATRWKRCNTRWEDGRLPVHWTRLVGGRHVDVLQADVPALLERIMDKKKEANEGDLTDVAKELTDD